MMSRPLFATDQEIYNDLISNRGRNMAKNSMLINPRQRSKAHYYGIQLWYQFTLNRNLLMELCKSIVTAVVYPSRHGELLMSLNRRDNAANIDARSYHLNIVNRRVAFWDNKRWKDANLRDGVCWW
ncbi:hypothetical protein WA026_010014 [Henosepilachna vigintioctopunctata]|uniref:Uncharacterized protein n=1 Tax=Henosepilachna vigintioctopunctata TaxID=420089 RepID=A0AAW1TTD5_9CUCU